MTRFELVLLWKDKDQLPVMTIVDYSKYSDMSLIVSCSGRNVGLVPCCVSLTRIWLGIAGTGCWIGCVFVLIQEGCSCGHIETALVN